MANPGDPLHTVLPFNQSRVNPCAVTVGMISNTNHANAHGHASAVRFVEPMAVVAPVEGKRRLGEIACEVYELVQAAVSRGSSDFSELDGYEESLHVKNSSGVLVYVNSAHRRLFSPSASPLGRTAEAFLHPTVAATVQRLDELIQGGCTYVECEHTGPGPDGAVYRMHSLKCSLKAFGAPGLTVLGATRVLERDDSGAITDQLDLVASCGRFRELSERDQEICRLTALGVSSRELGDRLGMTTRGIELRKQKAFAHLGVSKAVDLARLLTRLQDRGFVDLGL